MELEIKELKAVFNKIKNKEFNKSLRNGTTSIGYTFENLINKKEDNLSQPDYKHIEIKTKLGYTKSSLTLLCITPIKQDNNAIKYLLEKNIIYISFNIGYFKTGNSTGEIHDSGTAFKLKITNINDLFKLIDKA